MSDTNQLKKYRVYFTEWDGETSKRKSKVVTCHRVDVENVENGSCVLECRSGMEDGHGVVAAFRNWDYFLEVQK